MRALITGSRIFNDAYIMNLALDGFCEEREVDKKSLVLVHGGAKGADTLAGLWAKRNGVPCEVHIPDWSMGRGAGLKRNKDMLDTGVDIVIAFPRGEARGTRHMMKIAREAGVEVVAVE